MSNRLKVEFPGSQGENLSGLLELPDTDPASFVLFAHCFTCGKDIVAASRIAKELVKLGFAVLRFDFTGLGNSDGILPTPIFHLTYKTSCLPPPTFAKTTRHRAY